MRETRKMENGGRKRLAFRRWKIPDCATGGQTVRRDARVFPAFGRHTVVSIVSPTSAVIVGPHITA